jgi:hypothetical protein
MEEEEREKAGKRAAKFEDKFDGREECRILTDAGEERKGTRRSTTRGTGMPVKKWKEVAM